MTKPLLLDTYCKAGGCTKGYQRAGFYVVGVDIEPQKNYCGDEFFQGDAIEFIEKRGREFDVVHASPPCQAYSTTKPLSNGRHPRLVRPTRDALKSIGRSYVIENVPGAPLKNYVILCGTMFDLRVIRHRWFECYPQILFSPRTCGHVGYATGNRNRRVMGITKTPTLENTGSNYVTVAGNNYLADEGRMAMGIDWTTKEELSQAIPPAYTEWIGLQLRERLQI